MKNHFYHQNGLMPLEHKSLLYKKGADDLQQFDTVVGNPPYGGIGVDFGGKLTPENQKLLDALQKFEIFGFKKTRRPQVEVGTKPDGSKHHKISLFEHVPITEAMKEPEYGVGARETIKMAHGMPVEILFIERFFQLCKPGGWIAIIIPDGVLANSTYDYVRRFIVERAKVLGIVSLPRGTFKQAGTSAKTSILFLQKVKGKLLTLPEDLNYPVFLASVNSVEKRHFDIMVEEFKSFAEIGALTVTEKGGNPKIRSYTNGKEAYMVRGDKTLEDLMGEKPSGRLDANYWHPKYSTLEKESKFKIQRLGDFIDFITYGAILTEARRAFASEGIFYISSTTVTPTGINFYLNPLFVSSKDSRNKKSKKPQKDDLIFNRSGVGTLGRQCVFLYDSKQWTVSDDTDVIRLKGINPFYTSVYLNSKYGRFEIEQKSRGVSGLTKINFDDIRAIRIPVISEKVQKHIEQKYLKMSKFHDKAMEAKKKGNEKAYKENLETAEKMLRDLIAKTEAVIRGERKDVI